MRSDPGPALSVIIPALDEAAGIAAALERLPRLPGGTEVLVVDGGSRDRTVQRAGACREALDRRGLRLRVLSGPRGRAQQMNAGAARARGEVLLFLHADTLLPEGAGEGIGRALQDPRVVGGGFRHRFRERGAGLRLISLGSNLRSRLWGTFYGDQAIFVRRRAFEALRGFRPLPVFEDADLCSRLRRHGRMAFLSGAVRTSGRRFLQGGVLRTALRMLRMKLAYRAGRDPGTLVGDYWDEMRRGIGTGGRG